MEQRHSHKSTHKSRQTDLGNKPIQDIPDAPLLEESHQYLTHSHSKYLRQLKPEQSQSQVYDQQYQQQERKYHGSSDDSRVTPEMLIVSADIPIFASSHQHGSFARSSNRSPTPTQASAIILPTPVATDDKVLRHSTLSTLQSPVMKDQTRRGTTIDLYGSQQQRFRDGEYPSTSPKYHDDHRRNVRSIGLVVDDDYMKHSIQPSNHEHNASSLSSSSSLKYQQGSGVLQREASSSLSLSRHQRPSKSDQSHLHKHLLYHSTREQSFPPFHDTELLDGQRIKGSQNYNRHSYYIEQQEVHQQQQKDGQPKQHYDHYYLRSNHGSGSKSRRESHSSTSNIEQRDPTWGNIQQSRDWHDAHLQEEHHYYYSYDYLRGQRRLDKDTVPSSKGPYSKLNQGRQQTNSFDTIKRRASYDDDDDHLWQRQRKEKVMDILVDGDKGQTQRPTLPRLSLRSFGVKQKSLKHYEQDELKEDSEAQSTLFIAQRHESVSNITTPALTSAQRQSTFANFRGSSSTLLKDSTNSSLDGDDSFELNHTRSWTTSQHEHHSFNKAGVIADRLHKTESKLKLGEEGYYTVEDLAKLHSMWINNYYATRSEAKMDGRNSGEQGRQASSISNNPSSPRSKGKDRKHYHISTATSISSSSSRDLRRSKDRSERERWNDDNDNDNDDNDYNDYNDYNDTDIDDKSSDDGDDEDDNEINNSDAKEDGNRPESLEPVSFSKRKRDAKSNIVKHQQRLGYKGKDGKLLPEEKRHKCSACGKRFSRPSQLETHRLTHTGEKPHVCSYCNKDFNVASNLKRHIRTHLKSTRGVLKAD